MKASLIVYYRRYIASIVILFFTGCNRNRPLPEIDTGNRFIKFAMTQSTDSARSMMLIDLKSLAKTDEDFEYDLNKMGALFHLFGVPETSELSIDSVIQSNGDRFLKILYPIDLSANRHAADSMRLISMQVELTFLRGETADKVFKYWIEGNYVQSTILPSK